MVKPSSAVRIWLLILTVPVLTLPVLTGLPP